MHPDAIVFYRWPNEAAWTIAEGKLTARDSNNPLHAAGFVLNSFDSNKTEIILVDKIEKVNALPIDKISTLLKVFKPFIIGDNGLQLETYLNALNLAIAEVNSNSIKKVVITRKQLIEFNYDDFLEGFKLFVNAFTSTFTYILFSHKHGIWFGASPEILIEEKPESFVTMALAGTIKSESDIQLSDWKQKELEEHEFVSAYLREKLKGLNLTFLEEKLSMSRTGNLHHLLKQFSIQKSKTSDLFSLANSLHPTPAIGGIPLEKSVEFIRANEKYSRELYTGYIGPAGIGKHNGFFVNLRCGKLVKNGLVLFAGGGINKGSIAEDELNETINKMQNTLRFFT